MARSVFLVCCLIVGLTRSHFFLRVDDHPPVGTDDSFAVATDDLCDFTSKGPQVSLRRMVDIDTAMVDHGVRRNIEKNMTAAHNGTALGVAIVSGAYFAPTIMKLGTLLSRRHFRLEHRTVVSA